MLKKQIEQSTAEGETNSFISFLVDLFAPFKIPIVLLNSGHLKSRHNSNSQRTQHEKAKRHENESPVVKVGNKSQDLPAVQCKDTLVLDYDHKAQYSKRKIESNFDRYKELPDVDGDDDDGDENGQLSAADFEQLLSRPATTGDHFTFAAERSWLQNTGTDASDEGSMASNLFKLNIMNLSDGLTSVPFYLRHNLSTELFTAEELTDMHYRSKFFEYEPMQPHQRPTATEQANQNLLDCLKSNAGEDGKLKAKVESKIESSKKIDDELLSIETGLTKLMQQTKVQEPPKRMVSTVNATQIVFSMPPSTSVANAAVAAPVKAATTKPASKPKVTAPDDIQDWLDDILNE